MKFVCTQHDLNINLALVSRAVSTRPTHPVLANIKIAATVEPDLIQLTGFDLSLGIQTNFGARVEKEGVLTLPAKLLNDIVAKLPSGEITLDDEAGDNLVTITSASGRYQVRGMSAEEFPELPSIERGETNQLSATAFIDGLKGSLIACSQDETKQVLTGVYLKVEPERLEFAATDGHRLGIVEVYPNETDRASEENSEPVETANTNSFEVTVPAKALRELEKMLATGTEKDRLGLQFEQGQVVFGWGERKLTTRTLEGKYPDYRLLIPKQFQRQITLDRKQLLSALERIAVLADQSNLVKFSIASDSQSIDLSVESQDRGSGRESLLAQISGADLDIAFNIKYLMDGLKTLPTQEITISLNGPLEPVILTPLGGLKMTYLVMPVQLRN
ncbi:DNA polymerase III subunit beta [Chamaesiphon minutus]|uniref:Beta sliding clamp n=1 Tax=Chamaesiphon minutus (strain ATCC 27169 / PCC 6605) TaxID=1173020 RepID=K9UQ16_CHAP6|nr:DNA polymerase III subunit beta [Chamaesiphon minutus]AFY96289.1 DNA polymerase III, beta subunit [Chamaesiphon minutus PCC 6605]